MNTWSKEINLDDYAECKEFRIHYYTRRMNGGYGGFILIEAILIKEYTYI